MSHHVVVDETHRVTACRGCGLHVFTRPGTNPLTPLFAVEHQRIIDAEQTDIADWVRLHAEHLNAMSVEHAYLADIEDEAAMRAAYEREAAIRDAETYQARAAREEAAYEDHEDRMGEAMRAREQE